MYVRIGLVDRWNGGVENEKGPPLKTALIQLCMG